jgi:hypothetical protein
MCEALAIAPRRGLGRPPSRQRVLARWDTGPIDLARWDTGPVRRRHETPGAVNGASTVAAEIRGRVSHGGQAGGARGARGSRRGARKAREPEWQAKSAGGARVPGGKPGAQVASGGAGGRPGAAGSRRGARVASRERGGRRGGAPPVGEPDRRNDVKSVWSPGPGMGACTHRSLRLAVSRGVIPRGRSDASAWPRRVICCGAPSVKDGPHGNTHCG